MVEHQWQFSNHNMFLETGLCCMYTSQRHKLRYKVGIAASSIPWLLSDENVVPHILNYIADARCFGHYLNISSQDQEF